MTKRLPPQVTVRRDALQNPKLNHLEVTIRAIKQGKVVYIQGLGTIWDNKNPRQYDMLLTSDAASKAGLTPSRVMTALGPDRLKPKQAEAWTKLLGDVKILTSMLSTPIGLLIVVPPVEVVGEPGTIVPEAEETTQQVFTVVR